MSKKESTAKLKATIDGTEHELLVKLPTAEQQREGMRVYNRSFADAAGSGAMLRIELEDFMRKRKLWNDEKQQELADLQTKVNHGQKRIKDGGFDFEEAIELAKSIRKWRMEIRELISERTEMDTVTAEGQADNARFNYYVSCCLVYNDSGKPVFKDMEDYNNNAATDHAAAAATKLARLMYGLAEDYESSLEENEFLKEFGLVDEKNRFVNSEGKLVNEKGDLINEEGRRINDKNELIDDEGNVIDEKGRYVVKNRKPFLGKDGKPMTPPKKKEEKKVEAVEAVTAE